MFTMFLRPILRNESTPDLQSSVSVIPARSGTRLPGTIRPGTRWFLLICMVTLTAWGSSVWAQAPTKDKPASDVMQLINDLDDIDYMRSLIKLKLTPEQLDKVTAAITASQTAYEKKLKAIAATALAKMADQIRDVKQKTLKGEAIPEEFTANARVAQKDILTKSKTLNEDTIAALCGELETILTPEQYKMAAKLDKDAQIKIGKATANTQKTEALWFASYVNDAIFTVPRIVPILKEMRAAAGGTKTAAVSDTGGGASK